MKSRVRKTLTFMVVLITIIITLNLAISEHLLASGIFLATMLILRPVRILEFLLQRKRELRYKL